MQFSTLFLSVATLGTTTLAFAIATPASAQEHYAHKHYSHARYHHYRTIARDVRSSFMRKNRCWCRARATRGAQWRRSAPSWVEPARPSRACLPARARLWAVSRRRVWRHGGALRLPAELRIWRPVRRAVQCGWDNRRSAVPGGGRRFRSPGRPPKPATEPLPAP